MNQVIKGENVSCAWIKAIRYLFSNNYEDYNLIVEISNPIQEDFEVRKSLDVLLKQYNEQLVEPVANTIFPQALYKSGKREAVYGRFINVYDNLRRIGPNRNGTYFGRLVAWNYINKNTESFNQVEATILKLIREKQKGTGKRVIYEMLIYDPLRDCNNLLGFPCMSYISIKIRDKYIDLTAVYRNQMFITKAYGNYLGLGRLQDFISREAGYSLGKLTCIATHAELNVKHKRDIQSFLDSLYTFEQSSLSLE